MRLSNDSPVDPRNLICDNYQLEMTLKDFCLQNFPLYSNIILYGVNQLKWLKFHITMEEEHFTYTHHTQTHTHTFMRT